MFSAPRRSALLACLALIVASAAPAAAARKMADTVTVLPPVTIRGARSLDGERKTTTTIRLDRSRISRFAPANATEALVALPGVDLVKTGAWASRVTLRGLGGDRVLLMVDGVRMNGIRGHGAQASLVPIDRIEAIEVQPGASSAQYGSDAIGGVIQLNTHRSLFDGTRATRLTVQSRGSAPGDAWNTGATLRSVGPRAGFELSGGTGGVDAQVTPDGRVPRSGYRERRFSGRTALQLGGSLLDYEHTWSGAYDIGLPAFGDTLGSHGSYPIQARSLDRLELVGSGDGRGPDSRILASIQSGRTDFDETTVAKSRINGQIRGTNINDAEDRVRTRSVSVSPSLQWRRAAGLRIAGEFRRETAAGPRSTEITTKNRLGTVTGITAKAGESMPASERLAWSASTLVSPSWRRIRLELGGRFDRLDSRADSTAISITPELRAHDQRASGDAGLSLAFGALSPYAHLATGFRVPNLEERYYSDEVHGGMVLFGNPALRSERSESSEIGLRSDELGVIQSARLSAYRSDVRDLINIKYLDMQYGRPRFQYQNVKRARIEGLETELRLRARRVSLGLYGAAPRARDVSTGKKLTDPGSARVTADLGLPLPRLVPSGQMNLRVRWNDALTGVDTTFARPAFSTTSIELSSFFQGVLFSVAVNNLWNHSYREPLSYITESGRTVTLSMRRDLALGVPFRNRKEHL